MTDLQRTAPLPMTLLAGIAAALLAVMRYIRSQDTLERMAGELAHPAEAAMLHIVWHSVSAIMFVAGIALIAVAWKSAEAARWVAILVTAIFAILGGFGFLFAALMLGDAFAFYPFFFLAGVAVLSAIAAARAK